ncbi:MAG TPA: thiol-activated cytolysin family protein [Chitinophagaceae bacterium]|nr:thiol-activated cytolysin family protein [Chitinophagaceae bacterium]
MKKLVLILSGLFLTSGIILSQPVIKNISKKDPKFQQTILGKRKVVLAKGVVTDIKVNKPSNVQMTLKRASLSANSRKDVSNKKQQNEEGWICTTEFIDQTSSGDNVALSPLGGEIYPGLVFNPESFHSGTYQKISQYSRKPLKLTVDGNCYAEKTVNDPTEQNIASAVNQMRSDLKNKGCGVITQSFYGQEILSKEDLIINTAAAGSYMGVSAKMNTNFESSSKSYKYLVDYTAPYFSIQAALDINADNIFYLTTEGGTAPKPIAPEAIDPNWIYVKSVTYGKRLLAIVESNEDLEKIGVFAEGSADYGLFKVTASADLKMESALKQTTVRLFAIGGEQIGKSFVGLELKDIKNTISAFMTSTDKNYQPLSFKLKTIDDELVLVQLTSQYTSRKCIPKTNTFRITWTDVQVEKGDDGGGGNSEDIWARVKIRAYDKNGKGIPDIDNKVPASHYVMDDGPAGVSLATFSFGTEDNPKTVQESANLPDVFASNKHKITFRFPNDDIGGKMVIKSYLTEIDNMASDDVFNCGSSLTIKLSDAPQNQYKIRCTHEGSIVNLYFTIEPIYQQ